MTINRLIYVLTLVASFIFYMLYPPWISWYLFVIVMMLLPADLFVSLPGMLTKGMLMSAPSVLEMGEDAVLKLTTTHKKSYPVRGIIAKLHVSGDDFSVVCRVRCPADKNGQREVTIDTTQSGITIFRLKRITTVSLLGLFSLPFSESEKVSVLVLPAPVKPANTIALQHGTHLRPKPGGGFSEEHDMRMYRQGDPVRSIHWKISAKFDSLVIREPLVPPPHSRLVHIKAWKNASERDLILGRLRWVSNYMLKKQLPFYVRYSEESMITEITEESDLVDFLLCILDDSAKKDIKNSQLPARFTWVFRIDAGG